MKVIYYFISLLLLFIIWRLRKDYTHPAFITILVWFVIIFAYNFLISTTNIWIPLSDKFYLIIILYVFCFTVFATVCSMTKFKEPNITIVDFTLKHKLFIFFAICCLLLLDIYYFYIGFSVGFDLLRTEVSLGLPFIVSFSRYAVPASIILLCLGFQNKNNWEKNKISIIILCILVLIYSFISMNKGSLFQLCVCVIYLLKVNNKLRLKTILFCVVSFSILILGLQFLRSGSEASNSNFLVRLFYI